MTRMWLAMVATTIALAVGLANLPARADDGDKGAKAKPKVVMTEAAAAAVKAAYPKATIEDVDAENEDGIAAFEVELEEGGKEIELTVSADGVIMEIEAEVALKDVPEAARAAIKKAAEGGEIEEIEKAEVRAVVKKDKQGKPTLVKLPKPKIIFEAELEKGDAEAEIEVAADGTVIKAPKWMSDDEDDEDDDDDDDD